MAGLCEATGLRPVAIDGKAVRSAPGDTFSGCLDLVTAWAVENGVILGQKAVADGSHEIATIPALLAVLDLTGALVTTDAAGCQKEIARQVREQGEDYLLAVKGNQPAFLKADPAAGDRPPGVDRPPLRPGRPGRPNGITDKSVSPNDRADTAPRTTRTSGSGAPDASGRKRACRGGCEIDYRG